MTQAMHQIRVISLNKPMLRGNFEIDGRATSNLGKNLKDVTEKDILVVSKSFGAQ